MYQLSLLKYNMWPHPLACTSFLKYDLQLKIRSSCDLSQVGSADHHIHYYDLRNISHPLHMFSGHRKAVSYVKFLSNNELASASTDSTLRLWDVKDNVPVSIVFAKANRMGAPFSFIKKFSMFYAVALED